MVEFCRVLVTCVAAGAAATLVPVAVRRLSPLVGIVLSITVGAGVYLLLGGQIG